MNTKATPESLHDAIQRARQGYDSIEESIGLLNKTASMIVDKANLPHHGDEYMKMMMLGEWENSVKCDCCGEPNDDLEDVPPDTARDGGRFCKDCVAMLNEPECTCYESWAGHMPGCPLKKR